MPAIADVIRKLYNNLAVVGLVSGIIITLILRVLAPDYVTTGITLSVACGIFLLIKRKRLPDLSRNQKYYPKFTLGLNIAFFALLSYSLVLLYSSLYQRPVMYFICVALMSSIVAVEIFTTPNKTTSYTALIIVKIFIIAIILRWSLSYIFPGSAIGSDPWETPYYLDFIAKTGHLSREVGGYFWMPCSHMFTICISQVTSMGYQTSMMLGTGLFEVVSLLFIFLIGSKLFGKNIGLLAVLILAVNSLHIRWGEIIVAQSLGLSIVLMLMYVVINPIKSKTIDFKLLAFALFALLLTTHHLSSFLGLTILLGLFFGHYILKRFSSNPSQQTGMTGALTGLFIVAMFIYWVYITNFFTSFVNIGLGSGMSSIPTSYATDVTVNQIWFELNKSGPLIFYGLGIIGILTMLCPKAHNLYVIGVASCAVIVGIIVYGEFILGTGNMVGGRWFSFLQLILAVPVAVSLAVIYGFFRSKWKSLLVLSTAVFILTFMMANNTTDSPIYPHYVIPRNALYQSEIQAGKTMNSMYDGDIYMMGTALTFDHAFGFHKFEQGYDRHKAKVTNKDVENNFVEINGLLVLAQETGEQGVLLFASHSEKGEEILYGAKDREGMLKESGFDRIYDCGTVVAYQKEAPPAVADIP